MSKDNKQKDEKAINNIKQAFSLKGMRFLIIVAVLYIIVAILLQFVK